jgi:hypothetical protein
MISANITSYKNNLRISKESQTYIANSFDKRNGDEIESIKPFSGKNIKEFREALNKTQSQLAEDLSQTTNEKIDVETLDRIEKKYIESDNDNPVITSLFEFYRHFNFTGKTIRNFRIALKKTQPQFARELSFITGEKIDVKTLCRMETYGARDACHSLVPPLAVFKYIFYTFPSVSRKDSPYLRGIMKRHYYIRNRRCEVDQLDGVVAIKFDRNTRSQMPSGLSTEQLHVSPEELEVFENAGWMFSSAAESSDFQRGSSIMEHNTSSAAVFRREDGGIMIGTKVLTIKLKPELSSEIIERKLADKKLSVKRHLKFAPNLFEVNVSDEVDPIDEANKLRNDKDFIYAEPVMIEHMAQRCDRFRPTDPDYDRQWQWNNNGINGTIAHADVSAEIAWNHSCGNNVRIAVIDTGFDVQHQDLNSGVNYQSGYFDRNEEFVQSLTGYPNNAHGTFCAGIAGARANNGFGGCGIAFESDLLLIACLQDQVTTQNTLARAIAYAANPSTELVQMATAGADIISCSLGPKYPFRMQSILEDAINSAATEGRNGKGTSIFWAVNNLNVNFSDQSNASNQSICIDEVCCDPNVMAVGRSNSSDLADAAYGSQLDFVAPGVNVYSTLPNNQYGIDTGTSFATPCAAGVAALLLSIKPDLTSTQIRQVLRETCDQVGEVTYDTKGHNLQYGFGRINATRAMNLILPVARSTSLGIFSVCYASVFTICLTLFA